MGYKAKQLKKRQGTKYLHKKLFPQKTMPNILSMGYAGMLKK